MDRHVPGPDEHNRLVTGDGQLVRLTLERAQHGRELGFIAALDEEAPTTSGPSSRWFPFLKIDKGLADEANGVQVMKAMPNLCGLTPFLRRIDHSRRV
jgi:hypothetical protein